MLYYKYCGKPAISALQYKHSNIILFNILYAWTAYIIYLPAYSDVYNVQSSHVNYYHHNIIITHALG